MNQFDNLKSKTISGVKWSGIGQLLVNVFDFAIYVILARILFPEDFGVFAMATIFTGLIVIINQLGLEIAIVQKKELEEAHLSTTFGVILAFGVVLFLAVSGSTFFLTNYFSNPLVQPVLMVLSLNFIITDLGFIHLAVLQRNVEFKKIAYIETITIIVGGIASISMALSGLGVWSLVGGWIIQSCIRTVTAWYFCSWRPSRIFEFQKFRELFDFGKKVVVGRTLYHLANNSIHLLIGKLYGESVLGIYYLATRLASLPATKLSSIISRVALPIYSTVQDDNRTINKIFQKKIKYITLVCFPLLFGLIITAPRFIEIVYGSKWLKTIVHLQTFCFMGMAMNFIPHALTIVRAKGRPDLEVRWSLLYFIFLPLSFIGTCYFVSTTNVFRIITFAYIILTMVLLSYSNSLIRLKTKEFIANLYPGVVPSALMTAGILIYEKLIGHVFVTSDKLGLILPVVLGAGIFLISFRFLFKSTYQEIVEILFNKHLELQNQ